MSGRVLPNYSIDCEKAHAESAIHIILLKYILILAHKTMTTSARSKTHDHNYTLLNWYSPSDKLFQSLTALAENVQWDNICTVHFIYNPQLDHDHVTQLNIAKLAMYTRITSLGFLL